MKTSNKAILILLLSSFDYCLSMESITSFTTPLFDAVPNDIIKEIIVALASTSTNFSEFAYSVNSFSHTCRRHHREVNDVQTTIQLINALKAKQFISPDLRTTIDRKNLIDHLRGSAARDVRRKNEIKTFEIYVAAVLATPGSIDWLAQQMANEEQNRLLTKFLFSIPRIIEPAQEVEFRRAATSVIKTKSININTSNTPDGQISPFRTAATNNHRQAIVTILNNPDFNPTPIDREELKRILQEPGFVNATQTELKSALVLLKNPFATFAIREALDKVAT